MLAGIRDILIISTPARPAGASAVCWATAADYGVRFSYAEQPSSRRPGAGIPHRRGVHRRRSAYAWCWATTSSTARASRGCSAKRCATPRLQDKATVFGYCVNDPERYGVAEFDGDGQLPQHRGETRPSEEQLRRRGPLLLSQQRGARSPSTSSLSKRGELEITSVNQEYPAPRTTQGADAAARLRLARHGHRTTSLSEASDLHRGVSRSGRG